MKQQPTKIPGLFVIETDMFPDQRGSFIKLFVESDWQKAGLLSNFKESYYSISHKGVIRGMHFQAPPHEHTKVVYVTDGQIQDVVIDLRKGSPTYGQHLSFDLSAENHAMVYIPPGLAHGFESLSEGTTVTYLQNSEHFAEADLGIHSQTFGMEWQTTSPIMSQRDQKFPSLTDFETPFQYQNPKSS